VPTIFPQAARQASVWATWNSRPSTASCNQDSFGLNVSVFPRVFLPSPWKSVGTNTASLLLPVWVQKDWSGGWSAFGGGGCVTSERSAQNYCLTGGVITYQLIPKLQLGVELFKPPPPPPERRPRRASELPPSTTLMKTTTCLAPAGGESRTPTRQPIILVCLCFIYILKTNIPMSRKTYLKTGQLRSVWNFHPVNESEIRSTKCRLRPCREWHTRCGAERPVNSRRLNRSPRRRASSVGGTTTPSALAVLRLITSSNLFGGPYPATQHMD
jgi:hypothetical protein